MTTNVFSVITAILFTAVITMYLQLKDLKYDNAVLTASNLVSQASYKGVKEELDKIVKEQEKITKEYEARLKNSLKEIERNKKEVESIGVNSNECSDVKDVIEYIRTNKY